MRYANLRYIDLIVGSVDYLDNGRMSHISHEDSAFKPSIQYEASLCVVMYLEQVHLMSRCPRAVHMAGCAAPLK